MIRIHRSNAHPRRGAAAAEFALLLPLVCVLFVITVDYSRAFYYSIAVSNCAREAALYGSLNPTTANDTTAIEAAAKREPGNLTVSSITVTSTTDSATSPTYVTVTVTYPFTTITRFPGVATTTTLKSVVKMTVTPLTPNTTASAS
jgi:Flp pilus assembly protein TadG